MLQEKIELQQFSLGSCPPTFGRNCVQWITSGDQVGHLDSAQLYVGFPFMLFLKKLLFVVLSWCPQSFINSIGLGLVPPPGQVEEMNMVLIMPCLQLGLVGFDCVIVQSKLIGSDDKHLRQNKHLSF